MVIFQSFYMNRNYTSKLASNMAASGCLVGRLALVTGKPLFCDLHLQLSSVTVSHYIDANELSLRNLKRGERYFILEIRESQDLEKDFRGRARS